MTRRECRLPTAISGNIPFDFLNAEIDLAHTLTQVAETECSLDPEHADCAIAKAREALTTVKHFAVE